MGNFEKKESSQKREKRKFFSVCIKLNKL